MSERNIIFTNHIVGDTKKKSSKHPPTLAAAAFPKRDLALRLEESGERGKGGMGDKKGIASWRERETDGRRERVRK